MATTVLTSIGDHGVLNAPLSQEVSWTHIPGEQVSLRVGTKIRVLGPSDCCSAKLHFIGTLATPGIAGRAGGLQKVPTRRSRGAIAWPFGPLIPSRSSLLQLWLVHTLSQPGRFLLLRQAVFRTAPG